MRCDELCFSGDSRLYGLLNSARALVPVKNAKKDKDKFVSLPPDPDMYRILDWMRERGGEDRHAKLFNISHRKLDRHFRNGLIGLDLGNVVYSLHSIRNGGATQE